MPWRSAATAVSSDDLPVNTTASVSGESCFARAITSMPLRAGHVQIDEDAVVGVPIQGGQGRGAVGADRHLVPHPRQFETHHLLQRSLVVGKEELQSFVRLGSDGQPPAVEREHWVGQTFLSALGQARMPAPLVLAHEAGQRQPDAEAGAASSAGAGGFDVAAVVGNDAMGDREPQSDSLAAAAAGKERLEDVFQHLRLHAAAVVDHPEHGVTAAGVQLDAHRAAVVEAVQGVAQQVQHDLLDLLRIHRGDHRPGGRELDVFPLVLADMAEHLEHAADQLAEFGVLAFARPDAGEVQQLFGNPLAAEGLGLDHPQVVADDRPVADRFR